MPYADAIPQQYNRVMPGQVFSQSYGIAAVNGTGSELKVGRVVCEIGTADSNVGARPVKAAVAADFTAKTRTYTVANWSTGETVGIVISFRGRTFPYVGVFDTDNNTSVATMATALNVIMDAAFTAAQSIVWSASTGVLTGTIEIAGEDFDADCAATGNITIAKSGNGEATMIDRLRGVVPESGVSVTNSSEVSVIQDGRAFTVIAEGDVAVTLASAAATSPANEVYVSTDASGDPGTVLTAAGASRVWLPASRIRFRAASASTTHSPVGAVAIVSLHV